MKTKTSSCCGGYVLRKTSKPVEQIRPNPEVRNGVAVIYLGAGNFSVKGKHSGEQYYASDHQRHFKVYREDAEGILKNGKIIIQT